MLNERIKEIRKDKGYTQKEISKLINKAQNTYAEYETGRIQPDIDTLTKLADIYKISLDYLTGRLNKN